jgi:hypothetical protein
MVVSPPLNLAPTRAVALEHYHPEHSPGSPGRVRVLFSCPATSWLNQTETYLSVVQRKMLEPYDFADPDALERQLLAFGRDYDQIAKPFEGKFTRRGFDRLLKRPDGTAEQRLQFRVA